jgi:diguanylate cyclase (GGDEF)-like protein/PAS domain S-box-containing protein
MTQNSSALRGHGQWLSGLFFVLVAVLPGATSAREVVVGLYQNEPKIFAGPDGQPSGILGDLLQTVAKDEGWTLKPVRCEWHACLTALEAGTIDLLPDVAYSDDRAMRLDFHRVPSLHSWSQVYQRRGSQQLNAMTDLQGQRVALLNGSIQQSYLSDLLTGFGVATQWIPVSSQEEAFEKVAQGEADAAVANRFYGDLQASRFNLVPSSIMFQPAQLYYATGKGHNADLLTAIDQHLTDWKSKPDSVYQQTLSHWMGPPKASGIPQSVWWGISALLGLLLVSLVAAFLLRRQVVEKTGHVQASEAKLAEILNAVDAYIYIKNPSGVYQYANRKMYTLFGRSMAEVVGKDDSALFEASTAAALQANDQRVFERGQRVEAEELVNDPTRDGITRTHLSIKVPLRQADGSIYALCGISTDITRLKEAEAAVHQLAFFDPLTQLPNRRLLSERLQQTLMANQRHHQCGALVLVDIDHFKDINDSLGHEVGDQLLLKVAERLRECTRAVDVLCHLGGDEFMLLLPALDTQPSHALRQAEQVARKVLERLSEPFLLSSGSHQSSASVGVAMFSDASVAREDLLKQADLAMHRAKAEGRDTLRFFDPKMQAQVSARTRLEADLRQALSNREFVLYYQPQVDSTGRWLGAEALIRWQHPQRGMVAPNDFIPAAETCNLILPLGRWVMQTACAQLALWGQRPQTAHLCMAVNVSPRELKNKDFVADVLSTLDATGADPRRLELEITESHLVDDLDAVIAIMKSLKAQGVRFSLDDFGTGYSSLSMLKHLPLDRLKIDRSFVHDLLRDDANTAIVNTIMTLGQSLGLDVIAEGVETDEQRAALLMLGCVNYQGYLFSRPAPMAQLAPV